MYLICHGHDNLSNAAMTEIQETAILTAAEAMHRDIEPTIKTDQRVRVFTSQNPHAFNAGYVLWRALQLFYRKTDLHEHCTFLQSDTSMVIKGLRKLQHEYGDDIMVAVSHAHNIGYVLNTETTLRIREDDLSCGSVFHIVIPYDPTVPV